MGKSMYASNNNKLVACCRIDTRDVGRNRVPESKQSARVETECPSREEMAEMELSDKTLD